ncbi:metallophosphoesterase [Ottowia sp.]|uniref:metallophosphoesterase n=1 Tax=Ottowia sp. TaxID=1898956 RepID=UPI003A850ED4
MLIAHLTDPHIGLGPGQIECDIKPVLALRRALVHVAHLRPAPEVLLVSGDLTDSGHEADYQTIADLLRTQLPAPAQGGPQVLMVLGNHDLRAPMLHTLAPYMPVADDAPEGTMCLHATHGDLHFIGLDTVVPAAPHGTLDAARLQWLERHLAQAAGQPVVIFMHHPPLVSGMAVMDSHGLLQGRAELGQLVAAHGQVQLIAAGHMHRAITGQLGGAPVTVLPSVSHQLALDLAADGLLACRMEPAMVGVYRWTPEDGMACHYSYVKSFGAPVPI